MNAILCRTNKGFTLLELAVVLAVLGIIATSAIPYFIREAELKAAKKTLQEVLIIQDASRWYYLTTRTWPASIDTLRVGGFLGQSFPAANPWGSRYTFTPGARTLSVRTRVPHRIEGFLRSALPQGSSSADSNGQVVTSVIPQPGQEASVGVVRDMADEAITMARESAVPPRGAMTNYWGHGGGMPTCPRGYVVVRAYEVGGNNNMRMHCQKISR